MLTLNELREIRNSASIPLSNYIENSPSPMRNMVNEEIFAIQDCMDNQASGVLQIQNYKIYFYRNANNKSFAIEKVDNYQLISDDSDYSDELLYYIIEETKNNRLYYCNARLKWLEIGLGEMKSILHFCN